MRITQTYQKIKRDGLMGITFSSQAPIKYLEKPNLALIGCSSYALVLNLKTNTIEDFYFDDTINSFVSYITYDAMYIVVGYSDGWVIVYDRKTFEVTSRFRLSKSRVEKILLQESIVYCISSSEINIYDIVSQDGFSLKGHTGYIYDFVLVKGMDTIISCAQDNMIKFWSLTEKHCYLTRRSKSTVFKLALNPRLSNIFIAGLQDGNLDAYKINWVMKEDQSVDFLATNFVSFGQLVKSTTKKITSLNFDPHGNYLFVTTNETKIGVYHFLEDEALERRVKKKAKKSNGLDTEVPINEMTYQALTLDMKQLVCQLDMAPVNIKSRDNKVKFSSKSAFRIVVGFRNNTIGDYKLTGLNNLPNQTLYVVRDVSVENSSVYLKEMNLLSERGHQAPPFLVSLSKSRSDAGKNGEKVVTISPSEAKLWSRSSQECLKTIPYANSNKKGEDSTLQIQKGTCGLLLFDNRHSLVGTESGQVVLLDFIADNEFKVLVPANKPHTGALRSIINLSDNKTVVIGCSSKKVSFWSLSSKYDKASDSQILSLIERPTKRTEETKQNSLGNNYYDLPDQVTTMVSTPNGTLVCIALQNMKVDVHYVDTFKRTHSLYGHSAPVSAMDVNPSSTQLLTGSADKTLRIWDLQFGNCVRRFTTHAAAITAVSVMNASLAFSADIDGNIHQWDIKRQTQVTILKGHNGQVNCLDSVVTVKKLDKEAELLNLSKKERAKRKRENKLMQDKKNRKKAKQNAHTSDSDLDEEDYLAMSDEEASGAQDDFDDLEYCGGLLASVGQDFSLRLWSEDANQLTVVEEEEQKMLEDIEINETLAKTQITIPGTAPLNMNETNLLGKITTDSLTGADMIIEAVDIYHSSIAEMAQNEGRLINPHPLMTTRKANKDPELFLLKTLIQLRQPSKNLAAGCGAGLEYTLSQLPLQYADDLMPLLFKWLKKSIEVELCSRAIRFLLDLHHSRYTMAFADEKAFNLDSVANDFDNCSINELEKSINYNLFALNYFKEQLESEETLDFTIEKRQKKKKTQAYVKAQ